MTKNGTLGALTAVLALVLFASLAALWAQPVKAGNVACLDVVAVFKCDEAGARASASCQDVETGEALGDDVLIVGTSPGPSPFFNQLVRLGTRSLRGCGLDDRNVIACDIDPELRGTFVVKVLEQRVDARVTSAAAEALCRGGTEVTL